MQLLPLEDIVKMQPKGLVTIPKKIREYVGIAENDLVRVRTDRGRLTIEPVRTLAYPVRSYTDRELQEFIELDKKESKELHAHKTAGVV
jgi:AbrB family looped-hinge helix DNA binding protein